MSESESTVAVDEAKRLEDRVAALAADQSDVDPAEVTLDTHLYDDLNYDSLDTVEFTMTIEEEFEVSVPDEDSQQVRTVGDAVELLRSIIG